MALCSWTGSFTSFISTRSTLIPQLSVASSKLDWKSQEEEMITAYSVNTQYVWSLYCIWKKNSCIISYQIFSNKKKKSRKLSRCYPHLSLFLGIRNMMPKIKMELGFSYSDSSKGDFLASEKPLKTTSHIQASGFIPACCERCPRGQTRLQPGSWFPGHFWGWFVPAGGWKSQHW